jgi:hypothetical protein
VGELLARTSALELAEWQAYAALRGGLGARRADVRMASLLALLANVHRKPGRPAFKVADFMPRDGAEPAAAPSHPMSGLAALLRNRAPRPR